MRHLSRSLRFPALALLLFAMVANPILAAVGDVHDSTTASISHTDPEHCDVSNDRTSRAVAPDAGDQQQEDSAGDLLHSMVHGAHACGHPVAMTSSAFVVDPVGRQAAELVHDAQPMDSLQQLSPTRPPITA